MDNLFKLKFTIAAISALVLIEIVGLSLHSNNENIRQEINQMIETTWVKPLCENSEYNYECSDIRERLIIKEHDVFGFSEYEYKFAANRLLNVRLGTIAWEKMGIPTKNLDPTLLLNTGCLFNDYKCQKIFLKKHVHIYDKKCRYAAFKTFPNWKPTELWTDKEILETPHPSNEKYPIAMFNMAYDYLSNNQVSLCNKAINLHKG